MLTEGMFLVDRYEILNKVGVGGMADVYKAKDHILGRVVAIKVLKNEFSEDMNFVTKFRTEAQSAAGLEHPNIVNIYDVGSENGMHFIVMEYVEGITLKTYIEKKGQLSFKEATSIAIQVARGIETAHNKNLTHRDIKPQNIIISTEGKVKVTDFGIAKAISSNTLSSDAMGSVHYVSPEQARNGFIDGRSDIYSLGIVMYEMVTGRVPFDGETTVAVAIQHLQEEMVEPSAFAPDLPISYEKIVLKMTQKSPERRYQSVAELLVDLRKALVTPDEDFVVLTPVVASTTRVINGDELEVIQSATENTDLKRENKFVSVDDEDEEDIEEETDDEEDDDDTLLLDPKMEKIVSVAGIAILAIIVIIVLFLLGNMLGLFRGGNNDRPNNDTEMEQTETVGDTEEETDEFGIEMISIEGQLVENVESTLSDLGLKVNIKEYKKSTQPDGTILEQSVKKGDKVAEGTIIDVVVAGVDPRDMVKIPTVINLSENNAKIALENAGFKVNIERKAHNSVAKGTVISQNPNQGEKAAKDTYVTIVVSDGKPKVTVPTDLVGKDVMTAGAQLQSVGLGFVTEEVYHDTYAKGVVTKVDGAGTQVDSGATVKVYVSKGVSNVQVPTGLTGQSLSTVKSKLESLGFKVTTSSDYNETVAVDSVYKVDNEGKELPKGSTVNVYVSKGPAPITVPDLTGKTGTEAQTTLQNLGFVVDVVQQYDLTQPSGTVFKVDKAGTQAKKGDKITIYVSLGAASSNEPSSEPSSEQSSEDAGAGASVEN